MTTVGTSVLILETNERNLALMKDALEARGLSVLGSGDAGECISLAASERIPDVALLDAAGAGPSFWEACGALHEMGVPFVVIVPSGGGGIAGECIGKGAGSVMVKPTTVDALVTVIRNMAG